MIPDDRLYSGSGVWIKLEGDVATLGVTPHFLREVEWLTQVELAEPGEKLARLQPCGALESSKAVRDVPTPLSGQVMETNQKILAAPETLLQDPWGEGWLLKLRLDCLSEAVFLLSAQEFERPQPEATE